MKSFTAYSTIALSSVALVKADAGAGGAGGMPDLGDLGGMGGMPGMDGLGGLGGLGGLFCGERGCTGLAPHTALA